MDRENVKMNKSMKMPLPSARKYYIAGQLDKGLLRAVRDRLKKDFRHFHISTFGEGMTYNDQTGAYTGRTQKEGPWNDMDDKCCIGGHACLEVMGLVPTHSPLQVSMKFIGCTVWFLHVSSWPNVFASAYASAKTDRGRALAAIDFINWLIGDDNEKKAATRKSRAKTSTRKTPPVVRTLERVPGSVDRLHSGTGSKRVRRKPCKL